MENKKILDSYKSHKDLKKMNIKELKILSNEVRKVILDLSLKQDIHLSSNLGIVELSTTILKVFDIEKDTILYDTGHQTYTHKILTDRKDKINTIRQENGLSGLMNMNESSYDHYSPGHSGNIISIASGMYQKIAVENKNINKQEYYNNKQFICVIGDSAFSNGLNFEALNDISFTKEPIIIILNDNGMSISKSVGGLSKMFSTIKSKDFFRIIEVFLRKILKFSKFYYFIFNLFTKIENKIIGKNLFISLGFNYIGPVDGNDIKKTEKILKRAKWLSNQGPVIVHVKTKKGKGDKESELDVLGDCHSSTRENSGSYGKAMTDALLKIMDKNKKIYVINPAMTRASNCEIIANKYPSRFFDVGIAEEHAVSKASGLALAGLKPYIYFYSTFLQRGYDQLLHDVSRLKLNLTILIDRSDLSGGDGSSHHGIFDVGFLKTIDNVLISSGRNIEQNIQLLTISNKYNDGIFAIRYPKGNFIKKDINLSYEVKLGEWEFFEKNKNADTVIVTYGPYFNKIHEEFYNKNINLVNAIFITKYNKNNIKNILNKYKKIIIYERIFLDNGLAADFYKESNKIKLNNNIISMNYKKIPENGSTLSLDKENKMDILDIKNNLIY